MAYCAVCRVTLRQGEPISFAGDRVTHRGCAGGHIAEMPPGLRAQVTAKLQAMTEQVADLTRQLAWERKERRHLEDDHARSVAVNLRDAALQDTDRQRLEVELATVRFALNELATKVGLLPAEWQREILQPAARSMAPTWSTSTTSQPAPAARPVTTSSSTNIPAPQDDAATLGAIRFSLLELDIDD